MAKHQTSLGTRPLTKTQDILNLASERSYDCTHQFWRWSDKKIFLCNFQASYFNELLLQSKYLTSCWVWDVVPRDFCVGVGVLHTSTNFHTRTWNVAGSLTFYRRCYRVILPRPILNPHFHRFWCVCKVSVWACLGSQKCYFIWSTVVLGP